MAMLVYTIAFNGDRLTLPIRAGGELVKLLVQLIFARKRQVALILRLEHSVKFVVVGYFKKSTHNV